MQIKQWEDKHLAHYSYSILNEQTHDIILIDPSRDPKPYIDYARENSASITAVVETHPHADFASGHLELQQLTNCTLYTHEYTGAAYAHQHFNDGASISFGNLKFTSLHTPGHSPDSICILLEEDGKQVAVFTGDTLFIGDCGRPDLREAAGSIQLSRNELAKKMYHSLRGKLMPLADHVLVYPAHGAGTLCGKNLSKERSSTMGQEKQTNWCLQGMTEDEFVKELLSDQPFVPAYFPFDVELNRQGAPALQASLDKIKIIVQEDAATRGDILIVDTRPAATFRKGHAAGALNLMEDGKFETWLGSIVRPNERFILAGKDESQIRRMLARTASIGYEAQVDAAFVAKGGEVSEQEIDLDAFRANPDDYTIIDVRNTSETKSGKPFSNSIAIPLGSLRDQLDTIPADKPIVVHCAGGYRSAAGSSLIRQHIGSKVPVFDLGEQVKEFNLVPH